MKHDNNDFTNDERKEGVEDWRNEHGYPTFRFLESLVEENSPSSLEKLKSIADDLDVAYEDNIPSQDLVEKIILATQNGTNVTS